jgi:hypothetical protein
MTPRPLDPSGILTHRANEGRMTAQDAISLGNASGYPDLLFNARIQATSQQTNPLDQDEGDIGAAQLANWTEVRLHLITAV